VKRSFLVPMGVAVAAVGAKAGPAHLATPAPEAASGNDGFELGAVRMSRQQLLALAGPSRTDPLARTAITKLAATLTLVQEVPKPKVAGVGATGHFTATLSGRMLSWKLTFAHLSGAASSAGLHIGARGEAGPRFARLCGPCRSGANGVLVLTQTHVAEMRAGLTYVTVGTPSNPGGEVRGQIRRQVASVYPPPAPPPSGHYSHVSHASHASHASHSSHVSSS
jgi:hypothetical protein